MQRMESDGAAAIEMAPPLFKRYHSHAARVLQSYARLMVARNHWQRAQAAIIAIQAASRGMRVRWVLYLAQAAISAIQAASRGMRARLVLSRCRRALDSLKARGKCLLE